MGSPIKVLRTFYSFSRSLEKVYILSGKAYQNGSILLKEKLRFSLADSDGQEGLLRPESDPKTLRHAKRRIGVALHTF